MYGKIMIWSLLVFQMSGSWGQCFTFDGKVVDASTGQPISANFTVRTESRKQAIGKSNDLGIFSLKVPCNITSLIIEKSGFRPISMPVTGKDGNYYFEIGLFRVDKQTNDRPYFQSEQKDLVLDNSEPLKTDKKAVRLFKLVDIISKIPVKGEVCLFYTKTGAKTCFSTEADFRSQKEKIVFTSEDIIGLVANADGYQSYNGNLIIDRLDNSSSVYEIAMSRQVSILAFSISPEETKTKYLTELVRNNGKKIIPKLVDAFRGYSIVSTEESLRINVTSSTTTGAPISISLPQFNGLLLVKIDLTDNQRRANAETVQTLHEEPHFENPTLAPPDRRVIYFDQSSYDLRPSSMQTLDSLAMWLSQNPKYRIEIVGHTDNIGDRNRNLILSEFRSKVTCNYLVNRGVARRQVHWQARGGEQPAFSNSEEKTKALNRRVELSIVR